MLDKIRTEYDKFLKNKANWQKEMWKLNLNKLYVISWITCIGKNFLIDKFKLPTLYSYKTWNNVSLRWRQIYVEPEKFYKNMVKWLYFDIYWLNDKYYAYSLEDYFILSKEYDKVFVDISIESIYEWLKYNPKKIIILDYDDKQLEFNIEKRIKERWYDKNRIQKLMKIINDEKKMLKEIKKTNKDLIYLKELKNLLK